MDRRYDPNTTSLNSDAEGAPASREWLVGGGEMGDLIRSLDWSRTPLGPRDSWSGALRTAVGMVVASRFPMALLLGRDLTFIYNDAYRVIAGGMHPSALGRSNREIWPEVWHVDEPIFAAVMDRGETVLLENARFPINRHGYDEDAYFTLCYSPVRTEGGAVGGTLVTLQETTARVLERRRTGEDLHQGTALLRAISDTSADVIFAKDRHGRMQFANPAALALIGKPLEAVVGKTDAEFLEDAEAARLVMENDRRIMNAGVAEEVEERVPLPDGSERVWLSRKSPYRDPSGAVVGLLGISRDITDRKRAEAALRDNEEHLRSVLENTSEGLVLFDPSGNITYQNPAALRIHSMEGSDRQYRRDEIPLTWTVRNEAGGPPLPFDEWVIPRVLRGERVQSKRHYVRCEQNGREFVAIYSGCSVRRADGQVAYGFLTMRDITAQVRAEEALRASEEKFRSIFEQAAIGIGRVRFSDARWIDVNDAFCRMLGRSRDEMLRTPWPEVTHPEDVDLDLVPFRKMGAGELESYTVEKRFIHADGHHVWARLTLSLVRRADGTPDYEIAIIEDVSERKRAEEALREGEQRLRSVLENMVEGLVIFDASGNITHQNPASVRIHDRRLSGERLRLDQLVVNWSVRKYPDGSVVPPEHWAIPRVLRGESVQGERFFVDCIEDPSRSFVGIYSGCPVHDARGKFAYGFLTIEDITEQARAEARLLDANEKLVEADRRKDEFLGMLSHELRNPLAPIRNSLYILDHAEPNGQQARRAKDVANRQVGHLTRVVDDLLDVTRIARGKIELRRSRLDLATLARRTAEDYRALMRERGIALVVAVPDDTVTVDGDETRLAQVLGNLLSNAAKFTPSGGRVTLALQRAGARAVVHVSDTGPGLEPDLLPAIFDPFTQGKQTLARSEGGLGLGLALVKGIIELHGGRVAATSSPGGGAEFTLELPVADDVGVSAHAVAGTRVATRTYRVLVVDDNADAAESLAELVRMFGHEADVAYDGPGAVASAETGRPDVVLCDIGLPGMDGYEVARALRAKLGGDVRLVAVSGYAQPEDVEKAAEAGFDAHIAKPPDPARIERLFT